MSVLIKTRTITFHREDGTTESFEMPRGGRSLRLDYVTEFNGETFISHRYVDIDDGLPAKARVTHITLGEEV